MILPLLVFSREEGKASSGRGYPVRLPSLTLIRQEKETYVPCSFYYLLREEKKEVRYDGPMASRPTPARS